VIEMGQGLCYTGSGKGMKDTGEHEATNIDLPTSSKGGYYYGRGSKGKHTKRCKVY
jgi:hypothetical protein